MRAAIKNQEKANNSPPIALRLLINYLKRRLRALGGFRIPKDGNNTIIIFHSNILTKTIVETTRCWKKHHMRKKNSFRNSFYTSISCSLKNSHMNRKPLFSFHSPILFTRFMSCFKIHSNKVD